MKIVICGGGISGLSSAYYASKVLSKLKTTGFEVILLEKSQNVGGWLKTNVENGDRTIYDGPVNELGARSIRAGNMVGNNTLQMVHDMGLQDRILPVKSNDVAAKNRLIYVNKQLHMLPNNIWSAIRKKPPFSKPLYKYFLPGLIAKVPTDFESMHEVCSSRFGDEIADYLISSFCRGVFAADSRQLSMKAAFPDMWKMLKPKKAGLPRRPIIDKSRLKEDFKNNDLVKISRKEKWKQWTTLGGFQSFTEAIARRLTTKMGVQIHRGAEVESAVLRQDNRIKLNLNCYGESYHLKELDNIDHVIFALPSFCLSRILRRSQVFSNKFNPFNTLGITMAHIKWVDVAVVNVEFDGSVNKNLPINGFGHLIPANESSSVLGIIYDSCAFPQHDRLGSSTTRITCMIGGSWFYELFGDPDNVSTSALEIAALQSIHDQLGISKDPISVETTLCRKCIPTYQVGHTSLVEQMEDLINEHNLPISLVGASYWGVSVNDCIFNSRIAINDMMQQHHLTV